MLGRSKKEALHLKSVLFVVSKSKTKPQIEFDKEISGVGYKYINGDPNAGLGVGACRGGGVGGLPWVAAPPDYHPTQLHRHRHQLSQSPFMGSFYDGGILSLTLIKFLISIILNFLFCPQFNNFEIPFVYYSVRLTLTQNLHI